MDRDSIWKARREQGAALESLQGRRTLARLRTLLGELVSGWPRRGRNMLIMNPVHPSFALAMWETGFDVSIQEECPEIMESLRETLGHRAEYVPDFPDDLGFDSCSFDYVLAVGAPEYWPDRKKTLEEISRVACSGAVFLFGNTLSLLGISRWAAGRTPVHMLSPVRFRQELDRAFPSHKRQWRSFLMPPPLAAKMPFLRDKAQGVFFPMPVGAVAGVRVEFGHKTTGTPLLLRTAGPAKV